MDRPFIVFAGSQYYPSGGWSDLVKGGPYATLDEAKETLICVDYDWVHIVDLNRMQVVFTKRSKIYD